MARRLVFVALLAIMFAVGVAWAAPGDPFGGDDSGFIPPDTVTQKCEAKVGKAAGKYVKCVFACHAQRAKGKLATADAEDGCEDICEGKYDETIGKATTTVPPVCPPSCMSPMSIQIIWKGVVDSGNGQIYCEGTTPFGGDDPGFVPSTTPFALCESKLGGLAAKLVGCLMKCHESRSKEKTDATQEETCEDSCKTSYTNKFALITGCPPCLTPTTVSNYGDSLRTSTDNNNGTVYCAN
ncbi:MAG: hypothetical protein E6J68_01010 [Deltaproteobacteria bacterium]|nr:MAG: hypothetical protein E6J69_06195 [Deltaproteobacteria bacterium]TMA69823.1 MAG: hypothetical protein E6J68_01010 [Deltaproteobacteria bacterium]TMB40387.1 MAG: hypothetical protein E6J55_21315 [Deltaproteobacteria bacterium]